MLKQVLEVYEWLDSPSISGQKVCDTFKARGA